MNLPAGSDVPETGRYKCTYCGVRFATGMLIASVSGGNPNLENFDAAMEESATVRSFERGTKFTQCPLCCENTGWTLFDNLIGITTGGAAASLTEVQLAKPVGSSAGTQQLVDCQNEKVVMKRALAACLQLAFRTGRLNASALTPQQEHLQGLFGAFKATAIGHGVMTASEVMDVMDSTVKDKAAENQTPLLLRAIEDAKLIVAKYAADAEPRRQPKKPAGALRQWLNRLLGI